jgi:hypothetical protein
MSSTIQAINKGTEIIIAVIGLVVSLYVMGVVVSVLH